MERVRSPGTVLVNLLRFHFSSRVSCQGSLFHMLNCRILLFTACAIHWHAQVYQVMFTYVINILLVCSGHFYLKNLFFLISFQYRLWKEWNFFMKKYFWRRGNFRKTRFSIPRRWWDVLTKEILCCNNFTLISMNWKTVQKFGANWTESFPVYFHFRLQTFGWFGAPFAFPFQFNSKSSLI